MRVMSFMLTKEQIIKHTKSVTRRLGWRTLKVGEMLRAVEKSQGLKKGEHQVTLCEIIVIDVAFEPLDLIVTQPEYGFVECVREGFPELKPWEFVEMFLKTHRGCLPDSQITRIEFDYTDAANGIVAA